MKIDVGKIALVLAALFLIAAIVGLLATINFVAVVEQTCIRNGYAGRANLAGLNYCYRLNGETGELLLVDKLK